MIVIIKLQMEAFGPAETKPKRKALDIKEVQKLHIDTHGIPKIELHAHIGGCFRP